MGLKIEKRGWGWQRALLASRGVGLLLYWLQTRSRCHARLAPVAKSGNFENSQRLLCSSRRKWLLFRLGTRDLFTGPVVDRKSSPCKRQRVPAVRPFADGR